MRNKQDVRLLCNWCGTPTWHALKASYTAEGVEEIDENYHEPWIDKWEILQCKGCHSVLARRSFLFASTEPDLSYFPPRTSRRQPPWSWSLPSEVRDLLNEVYGALQANSSRLALMGIRTVIDVVILEKVGDIGSFAEKLNALQDRGFVGERQKEFLTAVLDAGSAAVHRGHVASVVELGYAMDIVENLLQAVYALEGAAQHLRGTTPTRQRRPKERGSDN
jgi:hypothetical protein